MANIRQYSAVGDAVSQSHASAFPLLIIIHDAISSTPAATTTSTATTSAASTAELSEFLPSLVDTSPASDAVRQRIARIKTTTLVDSLAQNSATQDGAAQRAAVHAAISAAGQSSSVVVHHVERGSAAHQQLVLALPSVGGEDLAMPCVLIQAGGGASATNMMRPMILHGKLLTVSALYDTLRLFSTISPDHLHAPLAHLINLEAEMSREARRYHIDAPRAAAPTSTAAAQATPASSSSTTRPATTTAAPTTTTTTPPHVALLEGVPSTSGANLITKTFATTAKMSARPLWLDAMNLLHRAANQHGSTVEHASLIITKKQANHFELHIVVDGEVRRVLRNAEEADGVCLQHYPTRSTYRVVLPDAVRPSSSPRTTSAAASTSSLCIASRDGGASTARAPPTAMMCEGGQCSLRPSTSAGNTNEEQTTTTTTTSARPNNSMGRISLRCSLPTGSIITVEQLDVSMATLRDDVRPAVRSALGHADFVFVLACPPKRIAAEEEAHKLRQLGILSSSAVRVVSTRTANNNNDAPQQSAPGRAAAAMGRGLGAMANSLRGWIPGRRDSGEMEEMPQQQQQQHAQRQPSSSRPARAAPRSMADILAQNEEGEREAAMEEHRREQMLRQLQQQQQQQQQQQSRTGDDVPPPHKKSKRYFGGVSTEFIGNDGDEDDDEHDDAHQHASGAMPPAHTAFGGTGRRLGKPDEAPPQDDASKKLS